VIHRTSLRAFAAATEDESRVRKALGIFIPSDNLFVTYAKGHFGNEIIILEATIKKNESFVFLSILKERLPREELLKLHNEVPTRVDENNHLHLRLDKQAAYEGRVRLTDSKDAIDVSVHIASYPSRRENAIKIFGALI
jgi:RNA-binding protein